MFFFATCFGSLFFALLLAFVWGKYLSDQGSPNAEAALRNAAVNLTVVIAMGILMLGPGGGTAPWYKQAPVKSLYMSISTNLKPRDKKGHGWLAPQTFDAKEAKAAAWMYGLVHKGLTAAICAAVLGVLASLAARPLASKLGSGGGGYVPPPPNKRPF